MALQEELERPVCVNVYLNERFGGIDALKTRVGCAGVPLRRT
jgi:hypothetical protein